MTRQTLKWIAGLALLGLIVTIFVMFRDQFSIHALPTLIKSYGLWAPFIFVVIYIIGVVAFLPGLVLTIAGGLLFGPWLGTALNIFSATVGATIAFILARYFAKDWVRDKIGGRLGLLVDGVEKEGWRFVAIMRLVPIFPFNILNYAFGLTNVRLLEYCLASAIFMLPGTFAYTYLGSLGLAAIEGEPRKFITQLVIAIGLIVLVAIIPWLIRHWRKSKDLL